MTTRICHYSNQLVLKHVGVVAKGLRLVEGHIGWRFLMDWRANILWKVDWVKGNFVGGLTGWSTVWPNWLREGCLVDRLLGWRIDRLNVLIWLKGWLDERLTDFEGLIGSRTDWLTDKLFRNKTGWRVYWLYDLKWRRGVFIAGNPKNKLSVTWLGYASTAEDFFSS